MSGASNHQFEFEHDGSQFDVNNASDRAVSTSIDDGSVPVSQADDSSLLTKVADLLDDVTESDPYPTRPLDRAMPYNDRAGTTQSTGDRPSLNSAWRPASTQMSSSTSNSESEQASVASPNLPDSELAQAHSEPVAEDALPSPLTDERIPEPSGEDNITLKGRGDGVAVELGNGDWNRLMARLDARLEQAASFFRGGQVSLNVGTRPLVETELDQVCGVLQKYGLAVGIVRTGSDRTFQSALNLGLAATMENAGGETMTEATFSASNLGGQTHFVYRGTLRSGQVLQRQESILIIGDVNPGGHVISAGDIMVWGRLNGVAHAGSEGDLNVIVGALLLEPTQLRIADIIAIDDNRLRGKRNEKEESKPAQIAYVVEGKMLVRPWQEARRGFRSVLRST